MPADQMPYIGIAVLVDLLAARAGDEMADVLDGGAALLLHGDDFLADRVSGHARGVVQGAEDQVGGALVVGDDLLLDVLVDRRFDRCT